MPRTMAHTDPRLAYKDEAFLDSTAARPLRILAEYLQPLHVFERQRGEGQIASLNALSADDRLRRGGVGRAT